MTEEIKTCDCKEKFLKKLSEFCFIAGAVFVGALLAILLSASILKPKCPPYPGGMFGPQPRMERPLPPPPMMHHRYGMMNHHNVPPYYGPQDRIGDRQDYRRGEHRRFKHHLKHQKPIVNEPAKPVEK